MFRSRKKILSIFLAGVFLATGLLGGSVATDVKWGGTTLAASSTGDPSLAAIAGYASYQVTWFNGFTLYERAVDSGEKYIYGAIASIFSGNFDAGKLGSITRTFTYTDPNGQQWTTQELKYDYNGDSQFGATELIYRVKVGIVKSDSNQGNYNFVLVVDNGIESVGWVDDASLEKQGGSTNLLQNPSFEEGSGQSQPHWMLRVWYGDGNATTDATFARTGSKSIKFIAGSNKTCAFVDQGDHYDDQASDVPAEPNTKYTLTAYVRNEARKEGTFTLKIEQLDSNHKLITYSWQSFNRIGSSNWFQRSITTPSTVSNVAYLRVMIEYHAGSSVREGQQFTLFMANT